MRRDDFGRLILDEGDLVWSPLMASPGFLDASTKQAPPFGGVGVVGLSVVTIDGERMVRVTLSRPVSSQEGALNDEKVSFFEYQAEDQGLRGALTPQEVDIALRMVANRTLPPLSGTFPVISKMVYAKMMAADPKWGWVRVLRDLAEKKRRRKPLDRRLDTVTAFKKEEDAFIRFREALFWEIVASEAARMGGPWTSAIESARAKLSAALQGNAFSPQVWM
jgi:hypothetical protein